MRLVIAAVVHNVEVVAVPCDKEDGTGVLCSFKNVINFSNAIRGNASVLHIMDDVGSTTMFTKYSLEKVLVKTVNKKVPELI